MDDVVDDSDDNDETEADTDTDNEEDEKDHHTPVIRSTHMHAPHFTCVLHFVYKIMSNFPLTVVFIITTLHITSCHKKLKLDVL